MAAKTPKTQKVKPSRPTAKTSEAKQAQTIAELRQELDARNRDLAESLQRESSALKKLQDRAQQLAEALEQTATSEILRVIRSSPSDLQAVMDAIAETSARLCGASDAQISRVAGNVLHRVASSMPTPKRFGEGYPFNRDEVGGRAVLDRQTIHIPDITTEFDTEFPQSRAFQERTGSRTILATPLLQTVIRSA